MGAARAILYAGSITPDSVAAEHIMAITPEQIAARAQALASPSYLIYHP